MRQNDVISLIHPGLKSIIREKGWSSGLTEIQKISIPAILDGKNCIIEAPTAGGKTEAVFFPCLTNAASEKCSSVQVLYIAPLRALLNDIELRVREYSEACGLHCFKWHGDVGQQDKIKAFNNPPDVLLTTPESLEAIMLRKPNWKSFFSDLKYIIIDEAHNLVPSDRGCHLSSLLERLCYHLSRPPQRIAISATIGNSDDMLNWLSGSGPKNGKRIFAESVKKDQDFLVEFYDDDNTDSETSFQRLVCLYKYLPFKKSIIFGNSRAKCESIASAIIKLNSLYNSFSVKVRTHHSSVSKFYREEAEKRIKIRNDLESGIDSIISTSSLELGIDIGQLDQVFQIDSICSSSAFLQRVGRSGRRTNKPQFFRGLVINEDDLLILTGVVSLGFKGISERFFIPRAANHILAHQIICLILQAHGIKLEKAWDILSGSYSFSRVNLTEFRNLVSFMILKDYLREVDGELVTSELTEKYFLGANWRKLFAVFDNGPLYEVFDGKNHVGNLDCAFVESMEFPFFFILGGIEWEAYEVKHEAHLLLARKTRTGNAPLWNTFSGSDVPFETAKECGNLLFSDSAPGFLNEDAKIAFLSLRSKFVEIKWQINTWVISTSLNSIEIFTFSGDKINRTMAKLLSLNCSFQASSNYKSISIKSNSSELPLNKESIISFISELKKSSNDDLLLIHNILIQNTKPVYFSKFGKCLSDNLISATIAERSYDLSGLLSEIKRVQIIC